MVFRTASLLLALLPTFPSSAFGQSLSSRRLMNTDTVALDPAVRHGRLPNGFQFYIRHNLDPKGIVEMRLVVSAGSLHEDEDQLGLAHLLEHMAFNGTAHYPHDAVREHFNKWGLVPGRDWNGSTGRTTIYKLRLPTDKPALYESGFQIMRDWAQDLTLDPADIDAERGVVLAESRHGEGVVFKLDREMEARLLNHPKYSLERRQRHVENIRTFEHKDLWRFFRAWYRADLEAFVVVGDIDVDDVEQRIVELFSDLAMAPNPRTVPDVDAAYDVELSGKNNFLALTGEDLPNTTVRIYHKRKGRGTTIRTVGDYRLALMDQLYNGMMRARLEPLTNRYDAPFTSVGHLVDRSVFPPSARIEALSTYLRFEAPQQIGYGIRAVLLELERVRRHGFLASELDRAREVVRKDLADRRRGTSSNLAVRLVDHYAKGAAAPDLDYETGLRNRLLDEIDVAAINDMVQEWLGSTVDRDVVIIAPASETHRLPTEREVERWFAEAGRTEIAAYRERKSPIDQLMADADVARLRFDTAYAVRHNDEIGTTELRLSNGITVVLKPFKPTGWGSERISLNGSSIGGIRSYSGNEALIATHAASIVREAGVGSFDKSELQAFLDSKDVRGGPSISDDGAIVGGSAPAKELETLLQLVHLYLSAPRRDTASFGDWKARQMAATKHVSASRDSWFREVIDSVRYPSRLAHSPTTPEEIRRLREDDVYRFYEERFTKPGDFTFVLAGDFDLETVVPLVVRYLGSLPAAEPNRPRVEASRVQPSEVQPRMGKAYVTLYRGTDDKMARVRLFFSGEYRPTRMAKLKLEVLAHALQLRMRERLREKEGGTYSVHSALDRGNESGNSYSFYVSFIAAPDNAEHMISAAVEEVERLRKDGLDPALFEAAVIRVRDNPYPLKSTRFWTTYLLEKYRQQEDVTEILKRRSLLTDILTNEAINEAARRYLGVENLMRFVLLPTKYQPPDPPPDTLIRRTHSTHRPKHATSRRLGGTPVPRPERHPLLGPTCPVGRSITSVRPRDCEQEEPPQRPDTSTCSVSSPPRSFKEWWRPRAWSPERCVASWAGPDREQPDRCSSP